MQGEQPLLAPCLTKEQQLKAYIQQLSAYKVYLKRVAKINIVYFLIHLLTLLIANLTAFTHLAFTIKLALLSSAQVLWLFALLCFQECSRVFDPHSLGRTFNLYITKLRVTQIQALAMIITFILLELRNIFVSKSLVLGIVDFILILFVLRDILKVHNMENKVLKQLELMREQEFYFVPTIKVEEAEQPFEIDREWVDAGKTKRKSYLFSYKKYYKPIKWKEKVEEGNEQIQYQLYSH